MMNLISFIVISLCLSVQDGVGRCECPEGFTGETCSTPVDRASPRPRSQSGQDPALSGAAIASVVVALLLTAVACGLLVMVFVCIRLRKKRNVDGEYYYYYVSSIMPTATKR